MKADPRTFDTRTPTVTFGNLHDETRRSLAYWFMRRLIRIRKGHFKGREGYVADTLTGEAMAVLEQLEPDPVELDHLYWAVERQG